MEVEGDEKFIGQSCNNKIKRTRIFIKLFYCCVRNTQTESRLKKDNICSEKEANKTHYNIGKNIRDVIAKNGGTMPEVLPTPKKSLKQLEKEKNKNLREIK